MSSWNIILCGDLPNTIAVSVTDPAEWTVDNLKQLVNKVVPKALIGCVIVRFLGFYSRIILDSHINMCCIKGVVEHLF